MPASSPSKAARWSRSRHASALPSTAPLADLGAGGAVCLAAEACTIRGTGLTTRTRPLVTRHDLQAGDTKALGPIRTQEIEVSSAWPIRTSSQVVPTPGVCVYERLSL